MEVMSLLVIYYFNWKGTSEESEKFFGQVKNIIDGIDDVNLIGIFLPTSPWHYAMVIEATNYDKVLQVFKTYFGKEYGMWKTSLGKVELLNTFEDIGFQTKDRA